MNEKERNRKARGGWQTDKNRDILRKNITTPWVPTMSHPSLPPDLLGGEGASQINVDSKGLLYVWASWGHPGASPGEGKSDSVACKVAPHTQDPPRPRLGGGGLCKPGSR